MTDKRAPGDYVEPRLSGDRLARQWGEIAARLSRRPARPAWVVPALAAALVAGAVLFVLLRGESPRDALWDGAVLESGTAPLSVALRDGSRIVLDEATRLTVSAARNDATKLALARGGATFDVAHVEGRAFAVVASGVEVRVVGTRFSVRYPTPRSVEVAVERGVVEVRAGASTARLTAGQRWSTQIAGDALAAASASENAVPSPSVAAPSSSADSESTSAGTAPAPSVVATPSVAVQGAARPSPAASASDVDGARSLFERANLARQSGDAAGAAKSYGALLDRFPSDPRAGLAAFELGRLQMDRLGDVPGAVRSLNRAIAMSGGSGFGEDALARLVTAYATMGARTECARARQTYLEKYPAGVHHGRVASECAAP